MRQKKNLIDTGKTVRISKIFNCSLDYLLKDEVEQMDINIAAASEEAKENKIRAGILTYLSFPPIFGLIEGIISLKFQSDHMKNKVQIALTILGMLFSLILTGLMVAGFLLELWNTRNSENSNFEELKLPVL